MSDVAEEEGRVQRVDAKERRDGRYESICVYDPRYPRIPASLILDRCRFLIPPMLLVGYKEFEEISAFAKSTGPTARGMLLDLT